MKWLIEVVREENGIKRILDALKKRGEVVIDFSYRPFSSADDLPRSLSENEHVIVIGSIELCKLVKKHRPNWVCYYDDYLFDFTSYVGQLHKLLINEEYSGFYADTEQMSEFKWSIYKEHSLDSKVFLKPNNGDKPFAAQIVDLQHFDSFIESIKNYRHLILASSPVEIRAEWRCIVSNKTKKVITSSLYRWDGNSTYVVGSPLEVKDIATQALNLYDTKDIDLYTIDVCLTKDGTYKIVELNSFSAAAIYASEEDTIINEIISYNNEKL
jgi:hypothetical protein